MIGMPNPEEEFRLFEEVANNVWAKYDEQIQAKTILQLERKRST